MNKVQKEQIVGDLRQAFDGATAIVLTEFRGLKVDRVVDLRKKLREKAVNYRVAKNTLVKRAIAGTDKEFLSKFLVGPIGIAWTKDDPAAAAKLLTDFVKTNDALKLKIGYLTGKPVQVEGLKALADLPSKDVLRAQLLSVLQGPAQKFVTLMGQAQRNLLSVLVQQREKLEKGEEAGG